MGFASSRHDLRVAADASCRLLARIARAALAAGVAFSVTACLPDDRLWTRAGQAALDSESTRGPHRFQRFSLDRERLGAVLAGAPMERSGEPKAVVGFPMPDGSRVELLVEASPLFAPALQAAHPEIRTYRAQGLDEPTASGRLDLTPAGFHGMLLTERGTVYVGPDPDGPAGRYRSYWRRDVSTEPLECHHPDEASLPAARAGFPPTNPSGDRLFTYRLAINATGEYTRYFGGEDAARAAVATTVNRVAALYEREFSIGFVLVATIVWPDPDTDPFTGDDVEIMFTQNGAALNASIGDAGYDIGHVFSQAPEGGIAFPGGVCVSFLKAAGATALSIPEGEVFDVEFVAHEFGHQFSAQHTWTGDSQFCTQGQFGPFAGYEPASGSTIMSYAGICAGQNVQPNADGYFHTRSYDEVTHHRDTQPCGTVTETGNTPPGVDAGPACTIPRATPFRLTAQGRDPDGDVLTYTWEQFDLGGRVGLPQPTFTTGPLFRSRPGTTDPTRTFPALDDLLAGAPTPWEVLPDVDRALTFRVTARDNRAGGGGVDHDAVTIDAAGAPFAIQSPGSGDTLECGSPAELTWAVGGGSVASEVEVWFSGDGGESFTPLETTANDGRASVVVPAVPTAEARLQLVPTSECFFALSEALAVVDTLAPVAEATWEELVGHGGSDRDKDQDSDSDSGSDGNRLRIDFSCRDVCDGTTPGTGSLNGIPVESGQIVRLSYDDELEIALDRGILEIEAPAFELLVECADASGNAGSGTFEISGGES